MGKPTPDEVEEHLLTCQTCQKRLVTVDEYIGAMQVALTSLRTED